MRSIKPQGIMKPIFLWTFFSYGAFLARPAILPPSDELNPTHTKVSRSKKKGTQKINGLESRVREPSREKTREAKPKPNG